jgi:hypothetical protein
MLPFGCSLVLIGVKDQQAGVGPIQVQGHLATLVREFGVFLRFPPESVPGRWAAQAGGPGRSRVDR